MSDTPVPECNNENGSGHSENRKTTEILDDLARQLVETRKAYLIQLQDVLARQQIEDKYL